MVVFLCVCASIGMIAQISFAAAAVKALVYVKYYCYTESSKVQHTNSTYELCMYKTDRHTHSGVSESIFFFLLLVAVASSDGGGSFSCHQ